jgi:hypothetical protein
MSEKSGFSWFKGKEKKQEPVASGNRESKEWELAERGGLARIMNHLVEDLYMAVSGGPKGIEMRFQDFTLTQKDLAHLAQTLPKEDEKSLVYLYKLLNGMDQKVAGDNPFFREQYDIPVKAQARAGLKEILSKAVSPESMLPPKPEALKQFTLEEAHWELADRTRDRQLAEGKAKEAEKSKGKMVYINDLRAFENATDIYRYSKLLGKELATPISDAEVSVLNSYAYFDLEPREEEVEKWEEDEEENEKEAELEYEWTVPNASAGFSYLEKLVDAGVPKEKLRTTKDKTYEIIEKNFERLQASKYDNYLNESHLRMLAAMKKVAPERFAALKEKFGKAWEESTIKNLPTEEDRFGGKYQMYQGEHSAQQLVDILEVFSDSPEIREAVQKTIKLDEKEGWSRRDTNYVQEELERISSPKEAYDMSQYSHVIRHPLQMAYLRKALAEKLAEPFPKF